MANAMIERKVFHCTDSIRLFLAYSTLHFGLGSFSDRLPPMKTRRDKTYDSFLNLDLEKSARDDKRTKAHTLKG